MGKYPINMVDIEAYFCSVLVADAARVIVSLEDGFTDVRPVSDRNYLFGTCT